jgi:nicotinamide-nucleotide amidase
MTFDNTVEIVTIGDELLLGLTIDTNAAFLSRELANAGFRVTRRTSVGDHADSIADAVQDALSCTSVVICTGGLGPTQDDFTKSVVADLFDSPLEVDQALLDALRERYRVRGIPMPERNITQAEVPRGATVLPNPRGTAPGLVLRDADGRVCILLPGVPHEVRGLAMEEVIPFLRRERTTALGGAIRFRTIRTTGIAESAVAEKVDDILRAIRPLTVAFLPQFAGSDLRITSWGDLPETDVDAAFDDAERQIRGVLESHIYGTNNDDLAAVIGSVLRERGLTLATAESCTGGLIAKRITDHAGSSDYFEMGVVTYANSAKQQLLGVSPETLAQYGAVSEQAVREMVSGAQRLADAAAAIAVSGVAGPGGGTPEKPVGMVWIAAALHDRTAARNIVFPGDREEIRERAAQAGLALLWKLLRAEASGEESGATVLTTNVNSRER